MKDSDLIAEMARVWVDGGGDAEGIAWCANRLRDAVQAEIERREAEETARSEIAASKAAFLANLERADRQWLGA
jgi:hypothetical protein